MRRRLDSFLMLELVLLVGVTLPVYALPIAQTGFNDASGINSDGTSDSPYELNATTAGQGAGEAGWAGTWTVASGPVTNSNVQSAVTFEGDGALHIRPTTNTRRQWSSAQTGIITIDYQIRFTANSRTVGYAFADSWAAGNQSAVWRAMPNGSIEPFDGGDGLNEVSGFTYVPDQWHRITQIIDVPNQTYRFFFDGAEYIAPDPLDFRGSPTSVDGVAFLSEVSGNGTYIDNLSISTVVPEPSTYAMAVLGLLGLGFIGWRRKRA